MRTIIVANPKGGSGKTTVATNLAAFYACLGKQVVLLDYDRQNCCRDWAAARGTGFPQVMVEAAHRDEPRIPKDTDIVIMDLPAAVHEGDLTSFAKRADILLLPLLPSPIDMRALVRFIFELNKEQLLERDALRVGVIGNRVRRQTRAYRSMSEFLEQIHVPCITYLRDTANYLVAAENGLSIFELPPRRVIRDLILWQPLIDWMHPDEELSALIPARQTQEGLSERFREAMEEAALVDV